MSVPSREFKDDPTATQGPMPRLLCCSGAAQALQERRLSLADQAGVKWTRWPRNLPSRIYFAICQLAFSAALRSGSVRGAERASLTLAVDKLCSFAAACP